MEKNFCTAPWNGLTVREDGDVKTCCVGGTTLRNLNNSTIHGIEKSDSLIAIRNAMKNNTPDSKNCSFCVDQESKSIPSLREHYNRYYSSAENNLNLQVLDIRWNNFCNLRCMYCGPQFSSTWDSVLHKNKVITIKNYQDELADYIVSRSHEIKELMLVGGEPMLMKQNYKLIESLPETSRISIITNLAYDLENLPCIDSLLSRKNNIVWNISLENTGTQFEYVRQLAAWNQIEKNLLFLSKHYPDTVSINFVYSMFSAFEIDDTIEKLQKLGVKKFNLIGIIGNPTMDVLLMPEQVKVLAAAKLSRAIAVHKSLLHPDDVALYPLHGADTFLTALKIKTVTPISKQEFYKKIEWYDQWSSQKFEHLWPHVIQLIELYLE